MSLHDFSGAEVEITCAAQSTAIMGATQVQRACAELKAQVTKRPQA